MLSSRDTSTACLRKSLVPSEIDRQVLLTSFPYWIGSSHVQAWSSEQIVLLATTELSLSNLFGKTVAYG